MTIEIDGKNKEKELISFKNKDPNSYHNRLLDERHSHKKEKEEPTTSNNRLTKAITSGSQEEEAITSKKQLARSDWQEATVTARSDRKLSSRAQQKTKHPSQ